MSRSPRPIVSGLIVVAWVAWFAALFLYASAVLTTVSLSGDGPTAGEERSATIQVAVALVISLALPAAALAGAAFERRRIAAGFLTAALALASVPAAFLTIDQIRSSTSGTPDRDDGPRGCVELSGGTSDCPGG